MHCSVEDIRRAHADTDGFAHGHTQLGSDRLDFHKGGDAVSVFVERVAGEFASGWFLEKRIFHLDVVEEALDLYVNDARRSHDAPLSFVSRFEELNRSTRFVTCLIQSAHKKWRDTSARPSPSRARTYGVAAQLSLCGREPTEHDEAATQLIDDARLAGAVGRVPAFVRARQGGGAGLPRCDHELSFAHFLNRSFAETIDLTVDSDEEDSGAEER